MKIVGNTILETWKKSIKKVTASIDIVPTERGADTYELLNTVLLINNPMKDRDKLLNFERSRGIDYTSDQYKNYWETFQKKVRFFSRSKFKQQERVVEKLKNNEYNRHGYISIWNPSDDLGCTTYPSCIIGLYFLIRNGKLNMTAILRSNDAWGQALNDIYEITKVQNEIAIQLQMEVGTYTHFAMSYHIYSHDYQDALRLLQS